MQKVMLFHFNLETSRQSFQTIQKVEEEHKVQKQDLYFLLTKKLIKKNE